MKKVLLIVFLNFFGNFLFAQQNNQNEVLAQQYYLQGDFEKAAALYGQLFQDGNNNYYFDLYFNSLLKSNKYDEADNLVNKLLRQSPQNIKYRIAQGLIFREAGKGGAAEKAFAVALRNLPADEFEIRATANSCYQLQLYDLAVSVFLQGRKTLHNDQVFAYELLRIYEAKKDKNNLIGEYLNDFKTMPQLLPRAESVLAALFENKSDYQILQDALLKKIKKGTENGVYKELLIWQYMQQQEYEAALTALTGEDKRLKDNGTRLLDAIPAFVAGHAYATAIKACEYLLAKGKQGEYYLRAKVEMVNIRYQQLTTGKANKASLEVLAAQYNAILKEYGKTTETLFALKKLADLQAHHLNEPVSAEKTLEAALLISGITSMENAAIKLDLGDIYILTRRPWEAILVYEQCAAQYEGKPIGNDARFRAARLSFYQGNFTYAKSQADLLKASTDQLIANDALNLSLLISDNLQSAADTSALKMYASAELLEFRSAPDSALIKLDSIAVIYPQNSLPDDVLMLKSKIYRKNGDFNNAVLMLKKLISADDNSIWTDDAIFTLADLYENKLKDAAQAKAFYQKLISDFPGSMYTSEARKRFRKLRGDNLGT